MKFREHPLIVQLIWIVLVLAIVLSLLSARWSTAFVSLAALTLSLLPERVGRFYGIQLPVSFLAMITVFAFATLFLGEVFDFYERYWWWDVVLHGGSAMGFGLVGFLFAFMLFEGDRYAAPPLALGFLAFTVALSIGTLWEVFEFAMDQLFGLNMQKSGLIDTMWDLIVDMLGAFAGAAVGYLYLKGRELGGASRLISQFVEANRRFFRNFR